MGGNPFSSHGGSLAVMSLPCLDIYTANSAFPVSPFLTDLNSNTTKNYYSIITVHQQEPAPQFPLLEIFSPSPLTPSSPTPNPKELAVSVDPDIPH